MSRLFLFIIGGLAAAVAVVVLAFVSGAVLIVPETHSTVVTRFGEVRHAIITGFYRAPDGDEADLPRPEHILDIDQIEYMREQYEEDRPDVRLSIGAGLYFKMPFIDRAHHFDTRLLDWDGDRTEVATRDLRTLRIDSASRWLILDPIRFYEAVGPSERHAEPRLDEVITRELEDMITVSLLIETVRNEKLTLEEDVRELIEAEEEEEVAGVREVAEDEEIRYGRMHVIEEIERLAGEALRERFGIRLIDVMITELNYTEEVQERVFDRMTAERQRIASRHRAEGEETKQRILGEVEEERRRILGNARAQEIEIVGSAHDQDPEFYRFFRTLEAYDTAFNEQTTLILSDDNELLRFMTRPD